MAAFVGDEIPASDLRQLIDSSYASFRHAGVAPLVQTGKNEWIMELFHGPTLAFKDFALQFLGNLLDYILIKGSKVVIMGATSGDRAQQPLRAVVIVRIWIFLFCIPTNEYLKFSAVK